MIPYREDIRDTNSNIQALRNEMQSNDHASREDMREMKRWIIGAFLFWPPVLVAILSFT